MNDWIRWSHRSVLWPILLLLLLQGNVLHGQWTTYDRDSLERLLDPEINDLAQLDILTHLAASWFVSAKGEPYLDRMGAILDELERTPERNEAATINAHRRQLLFQRAYKAKFKRDFATALNLFRQLEHAFKQEGDQPSLAGIHDAIGTLFLAMHAPDLALKEFQQAIQIWKRDSLTQTRISNSFVLVGMANAHVDLGRLERAEGLLERGDTTAAEDRANHLLVRARIANLRGDQEQALAHLEEADTVVQRWWNQWNRIAVLAAITRQHQRMGNMPQALSTAAHCAALSRELGDEAAECGCLVLAGGARMELGDVRGAENDLLAALELAQRYGYVGLARVSGDEGSMVEAAAMLRDLYRRQGRLADALRMTDRWVQLRDSLDQLGGREQIIIEDLSARLVTDSLSQALALAEIQRGHDRRLNLERNARLRTIAFGLLGLTMLAAVVLVQRQRRQRDRELARLEREGLIQERIIAEYRIRDQLGRDLHDDLGVGLGALRLKSELAQLRADKPEQKAALSDLSELSNELLVNMRQIIWAMDDSQGSLADTVAHCLDHARRYLAEHDLTIAVDVPTNLPAVQLPAIVRRNLFLIVKEALHNVVKHACADRVQIAFNIHGDQLMLTIADNGRGIGPDAANSGGHGLANMRKRAEAVKGELHIDVDMGCRIRCIIPLAAVTSSA